MITKRRAFLAHGFDVGSLDSVGELRALGTLWRPRWFCLRRAIRAVLRRTREGLVWRRAARSQSLQHYLLVGN